MQVRCVDLEILGGTKEQRIAWAREHAKQQGMKLVMWWGVGGGIVAQLEHPDLPKKERWKNIGAESERTEGSDT